MSANKTLLMVAFTSAACMAVVAGGSIYIVHQKLGSLRETMDQWAPKLEQMNQDLRKTGRTFDKTHAILDDIRAQQDKTHEPMSASEITDAIMDGVVAAEAERARIGNVQLPDTDYRAFQP